MVVDSTLNLGGANLFLFKGLMGGGTTEEVGWLETIGTFPAPALTGTCPGGLSPTNLVRGGGGFSSSWDLPARVVSMNMSFREKYTCSELRLGTGVGAGIGTGAGAGARARAGAGAGAGAGTSWTLS